MDAMKTDEGKIPNSVSANKTSLKDEASSSHEKLKQATAETLKKKNHDTAHVSDSLKESMKKDLPDDDENNVNNFFSETDGTCEGETCTCTTTTDAKNCTCDNEKASLEAENKRLAEEMLRMRAEMENSKKRLHRLFEEKAQENNKQLLLDIITLLDNFERAMNAGESSVQGEETSSSHAVVQGIKMMEEEFLQTLSNKWGLTRYKSVNLEFDPSLHEAMMKEYSDKVSRETVTEEFMKGYMFYEKVIRPAKVKIAVPKIDE